MELALRDIRHRQGTEPVTRRLPDSNPEAVGFISGTNRTKATSRNGESQPSRLVLQLRTILSGADADGLADEDVRTLLLDILWADERPVSTAEAARFLKRSPVTLKRWRKQGIGPTYRRNERGRIEYTPRGLREYTSRSAES